MNTGLGRCRRDARLLIATTVAISSGCYAQTDNVQPEDDPPETASYVDQLIDEGMLEPSLKSEELGARSSTGNLRSLIVEISSARISSSSDAENFDSSDQDDFQHETGLSVSGRYQTDNFGLIGLDAQLRRGSRLDPLSPDNSNRLNGLIKISSSNLPLGSGWSADSAAGMTTTPLIELFDRQTRFFVPVTPILGGAVTLDAYRPFAVDQPATDPTPYASVNLSVGEPGLLGGLQITDYTGLSGLLVSGGGQLELSKGLTAGVQAIAVDDSRDPFAVIFEGVNSSDVPLVSSRAIVSSMGFSRPNLRIQANAIWSTRNSSTNSAQSILSNGDAFGAALDAVYRSGRTSHAGGVYYFGPSLTWGTSAILSNAYGGFYRLATSSQRWRWTLSIDAIDSVDSFGSSGVVLNADVRRNLNFTTAVGANSSLRFANGQSAGQALGYVEFETGQGTSRAEAGWSRDSLSELYRAGFIQNWSLPQSLPVGSRFSTQVSYQHRAQSANASQILNRDRSETSDSFGIAASAGLMPFKDTTIDATIAYSSDASASASEFFGPFQSTGAAFGTLVSQQQESFSATLVASARLSRTLSLSGTYTDTTASLISRFGIPVFGSPLGPSSDQLEELRRSSFRLRAAYLTLRYSVSGGRLPSSIGARTYPVGGVGNLEGWVFLDENGSGSRDPAEVGVSDIMVILDGMQAVRTDPSGRYRFEGIADGPHRITVNADNLPLPWFIETAAEGGFGRPFAAVVEIGLRTTATLNIAAVRR